nr:LD-carboxypeptidase [Herbihabitans rhizosphaerae]
MRPPRLREGSRVAVVAPAGPAPEHLLDTGLAVLREWGLDVRVGEHVRERHPKLRYLAGTDSARAADLERAWCDPDVEAVFCVRGGYGCLRMVDLLDWDAMAAAGPKVFVGSSDVTVLHQAIGDNLGVSTLFGPMAATESFTGEALTHLRSTLFEPETVLRLSGPKAATMEHGVARGITVGGNLSLLAATVGSSPPPPDDAIVLLEDITESPYRLDGYITQLQRTGFFTGVSGIALGSWRKCGDPDAVYAVMADLLASLGMPTVWELGFGHCEDALTVPLGVMAELNADEGTLVIEEPALT